MRTISLLSIAAASLLFPSVTGADTLDTLFTQANNAFWNGDYEEAAEVYSRIEELGVQDSALSYNLGTAHARLGRLGMAVRDFERALRLDPGQDDARHNLSVIREFIARRASESGRDADLAPAAGPWRALLDRFSSRGAALAFLFFHIALFLTLSLRRFVLSEMPRLSLGVAAGIFAVLTAVTFAVAVGKWHQDRFVKEAVVISDGEQDVMEGPKSEVMRFALVEGSRVRILDEISGWARVLDCENRDGWVPSKALGRI